MHGYVGFPEAWLLCLTKGIFRIIRRMSTRK